MRKALFPLLAALALCGAATTAMVMSTAHAQSSARKPIMVAQADTAPPPPRRGFARPAPADVAARMKQMCDDQVARETGRLAYLETRLDLTSSEQPLFQRWKDAVLGVAHRRADQCNQQITQRVARRQAAPQTQAGQSPQTRPAPPSLADRMGREEDRLKHRLADIEAERPALEALTNALSPAQKMELARADRRGGRNTPRRFASAMGPRGRMGPMGGPMRGPGMPRPGAPL